LDGSLAFVEKIKRELGVKQLTVGILPDYYVELLNIDVERAWRLTY